VTFEATHLVASSSVDGISTGDHLVTIFTLDTSAPDQDQQSLAHGRYRMDSAGTRLTVGHEEGDFGTPLVELLAFVVDVLSAFQDQVADESFLEPGGAHGPDRLTMVLAFDRSVFLDDHLPGEAPPPETFRDADSRYVIETDAGSVTAGRLETFVVVSTVPEPGTFGLTVAGLLALAAVRHRLSRARRRTVFVETFGDLANR